MTPRAALFSLALFLAALPAPAQHNGEYSFVLLPDGKPRYTQVVRWEPVDDVAFYDVTVRDGAGQETTTRVTEPELKLSLDPGDYSYQVVLYNALRRPEITLPWQELTVLRAEIPRLSTSTPRTWLLEDPRPLELTVSGANVVPGATFSLKAENGSGAPVEGSEREPSGSSTLHVSFPVQALDEGAYTLEVRNPGGLTAAIPRALLLRHVFPPPVTFEPAAGSVFGPDEIRNRKSLRFSWKPVPGATEYTFQLRKAGAAQPLLRIRSLTDTTYVLYDLRLLDKGDLSWTVEAKGSDELFGEIPSVKSAETRLAIDLPAVAAPAIDEGDVFYGR
jgi:hypothetical protein